MDKEFEKKRKLALENSIWLYNGIIEGYNLSIFESLMDEMENLGSLRLKKRINTVIVELYTNIIRHGSISSKFKFIYSKGENDILILCENFIQNENILNFKYELDFINKIADNPEIIKKIFKDRVNRIDKLNPRNRSNLGLLEIVRKSKNKIIYDFKEQNDGAFLYSAIATINLKEFEIVQASKSKIL